MHVQKYFFLTLLIPILTADFISAQQLDISGMNIMHVQPADYICKLPPTNINANFFVRSNPELLNRLKSKADTSFEVDYLSSCGDQEWPQEAITAFEFAMAIWSEHINSDIPIKVNANWMLLEGNTLGSARPTRIVQLPGAGRQNTWYTLAQLSAIAGLPIREQVTDEQGNAIEYDIDMNVQCNFEDWYFGTDANVPNDKSDFVTVVLHEIGHGLGFLGSMEANNENETAEWGLGQEDPDPLIFDRFTADGNFNKFISSGIYPNPSAGLYEALTGNRGGVFFDGEDANFSLNEFEADRAKLYSPDPFDEGSSYSHFDQATFRQSVNALMLPFIDRSFAVHTPGPLFCGVLSDMGWPLGEGCLDFIQSPILVTGTNLLNFGVLNTGETAEISILLANRDDAELTLTGTLEIDNGEFSIVDEDEFSLERGMSREITISYSPNEAGRQTGTLSVFHNAKNVPSPLSVSIEGEALNVDQIVELDQSYPNPFVVNNSQNLQHPTIEYAISRGSDVLLDLYTISGQHLHSLVNNYMQPGRYKETVDMNGLSSGIYIYRIVVDGVAKSGKLMYVR